MDKKHGWIWENDLELWHKCSMCGKPAEEVVTDGDLVGDVDPSGEFGGYYKTETDELLSAYCPWCGTKMEFADEETEYEDEEDEETEYEDEEDEETEYEDEEDE